MPETWKGHTSLAGHSEEQIISVNGARLWTALQGRGRPLVLCHGGPGAYDYLAPVAAMLDDQCRVLRYDQRGSGRSQATGPYDVATFVADLEGLRAHLGYERWIVGGHSWGAGLALAYAVRHPEHTTAIVYLSGTGIDPRWHDAYRARRLAALSDAERDEYRRLRARRDRAGGAERARIQHRLRALSRKTDACDAARADDLPSYREYPTSDRANVLIGADWNAHTADPAFRRAVYNLPRPVLVLHGEGDPRPTMYVEALAARLPRGQFHAVPEAGHYPWIEQPEQVRAALRAFIEHLEMREM